MSVGHSLDVQTATLLLPLRSAPLWIAALPPPPSTHTHPLPNYSSRTMCGFRGEYWLVEGVVGKLAEAQEGV